MMAGRSRSLIAKGGIAVHTPSPNADFIRTWNEILVPKFARFRHILVGGFRGHSEAALELHPVRVGERVLDVGCGFGDTTVQLAHSVGPAGSVLGIDCCDAFLEFGRQDAHARGLQNAHFAVADAQTERFESEFDLCFARFGTMFFQSPLAAMRNLKHALKPGGRLNMLVWRTIADNAWLALPKRSAQAHLPPPPDNGQSCGPGPFSMADADTVRAILEGAGFVKIALERVDVPVMVSLTVPEAVDFQLAIGPAGELVREAGELGVEKRPLIAADLEVLLEKHVTPAGIVMSSSSWCVTAERPS
jgi:SAM-dependent methyltransferase